MSLKYKSMSLKYEPSSQVTFTVALLTPGQAGLFSELPAVTPRGVNPKP